MKKLRFILVALVVGYAGTISANAQQAHANNAESFIAQLGDKALQVLVINSQSDSERISAFRALLNEGFDLPLIGRYALGRYWRRATQGQKEEYGVLFEDFIVRTYAVRLGQYGGETLRVTGSRTDQKDTIVTSEIVREGAAPIRVDWRVRSGDSGAKIVDVVVEGVSMLLTQRDEFASVIQRSGGNVEGLLTRLREKSPAE